ncbi:MAG: hypothetical protein HY597_03155 [Candidatus Omnitrophica bacterium]|nr:hypothetical protein [Candidatus Omnitrophota bacterium]
MRRGVRVVLGAGVMIVLGVSGLSAWEADPRAFVQLAKKAKAEKPSKSSASTVDPKTYWNDTTWAVDWTPISGPKGKASPIKDIVSFEQGRVTSKHLSAKGYPTTNFSARIGDDGVPIWETMQTNENQDVVFWRGELHGEALRGIVSQKPVKGASEDYALAGQRVANPPKTAPSAAAPATKATASTTAASSSHK